jgi:uncharacterized protein YbjQ (UPF0145 family)
MTVADSGGSGGYKPGSMEGVPESGRARLEQNKEGLFTSDLTVNEFMLITEAGFDPLGLVVGSSIYHIGLQVPNWRKNQEMTVLSGAMYHARELAMTRMEEEADDLGADGIVGVRARHRPIRVGRAHGRVHRDRNRGPSP